MLESGNNLYFLFILYEKVYLFCVSNQNIDVLIQNINVSIFCIGFVPIPMGTSFVMVKKVRTQCFDTKQNNTYHFQFKYLSYAISKVPDGFARV